MKVTVCINDTKIVVPCGDGNLSIRQLAELAIIRYRRTALSKGSSPGNIEINGLELVRDGGMLDWDDKVNDVLDDRDMLISQLTSNASDPITHTSFNDHNNITPGDIITFDHSNTSTSNLSPVLKKQNLLSSLVSAKYSPLSFGQLNNEDYYNMRHNSIPCSDHDIHKYLDLFDSINNARHESFDNILDLNNSSRRSYNHNAPNVDYEKWPLPPFPMQSTLQSSIETTVSPKNKTLQLHDTDFDDSTWYNSPNDCDEEDYPRLRPDYIVKHFATNQDKCIENSVPSRQVLQWLESQECGSVSSSGGGGVGSGGGGIVVGTSSYEVGSDIKEIVNFESSNNSGIVLDDRNNNRVHVSFSSVSSSGNDHNRLREDSLFVEPPKSEQSYNTDTAIIVRITNIKPCEKFGIQISPSYIQDQGYTNNVFDNDQKCIYGIEVHSIMPNGRVAKEKQLNKGDKIIQINDISLYGMTFERGESIFREALQKSECKLKIIPHQYRDNVPILGQLNKANPPPPPRRSPNTALSGIKPNWDNCDKAVPSSVQQSSCKSPLPSLPIICKTPCPKLTAPPPPPIQQKPVASWTSGFGSMLQTPASSTSSVSAAEKKKLHQMINSVNNIKTELIELTKIGSGFGFSITGMENQPSNIPTAIYVKHILTDGAAVRDGRLKSDDRLLEIDGLLLDGMSQNEVISLLREKPSGSRVRLLVERNEMKKSSLSSASHDSLMTSLSEMDEDGSTLSKNKRHFTKLHFNIPLNDINCPGGKTTLGISVKVEPNWDKANITPFSSKEDIAASNIMWVKTVIDNGAAYRHGKLMVGDQVLVVNGVALSGLSSEEALTKLKNLIKEAQDSDEGIISMSILRKTNIARSSSLNTLNSVTGSSAMSYRPIFDHYRNIQYNFVNNLNRNNNVPTSSNQCKDKARDLSPNLQTEELSNTNIVKLPTKSAKRSAPLPPTPDYFIRDTSPTDRSTKSKPVPPPLARRIKNIESNYDTCQFVPQSTSEAVVIVDHNYASNSTNQINKSNCPSDEFLTKNFEEPQCSSTTNTLCRNKDNNQLILRARNTRSNCSYTPTKEILHIDDIDWDKMELIPFDNCKLTSKLNNPIHKASISQPVINQDMNLKRVHDTGVHKRKAFKKFSIGQIFRFKHSHYSKPSNSAGSSPINIRKHGENNFTKNPGEHVSAIPTSASSYSLKSTDQVDEREFPYAELDFSQSPVTHVPETTSVLLKTINNLKTTNQTRNALLPLPEESFKCLQTNSSEDSDSYEDFVDMQTTFPGHISAVQRITAAMPKQPPNRFVYEDAEELFQSLQATVSHSHDINLSPTVINPLSSLTLSPLHKDAQSVTKDIYQNIRSDLSTANQRAKPRSSTKTNEADNNIKSTNDKDLYFNWPK